MHHEDFLHPEGSHQREADSFVTHDDSGVADNKNAVICPSKCMMRCMNTRR